MAINQHKAMAQGKGANKPQSGGKGAGQQFAKGGAVKKGGKKK
tara:strand:- start:1747 stop:1875 length:129 start_codon:yes stop_codon:yes gene_type:complete